MTVTIRRHLGGVLTAAAVVGLLLWLAGGVDAGEADTTDRAPSDATRDASTPRAENAQPSPEARSDSKLAVYVPPSRGRAYVRAGGATRARGEDLPGLAALAPAHVGLTTRLQPTLSWYVAQATDTRLDFTVIDEEGIDPLVEITLSGPIQPGIHSVRLGDLGIDLETDITYSWFVTLVPDPIRRSRDVIAGGALRRTAPSTELQRALAGSEPAWASYATHGVWYDAIADLNDAIAVPGADPALRAQRSAFLKQIGLPSIDDAGK